MAEATSEAPKTLTYFQPDKTVIPERPGIHNIEIVADPISGNIFKSGDPQDVRQWIEAERSRAQTLGQVSPKLEEIRGGIMFPGMIDAHTHPFIYAGLEIANPINASGIETKEQLIGELRKKASLQEKGTFVVANDLDTTKIRDLTANDLDRVSEDQKVVVYDSSYHGCVVNRRALEEVERFSRKYQDQAKVQLQGELNLKTGQLTEDFVYMTWELIEAEGGTERLVELTEKEFEESLRRGITGLHDMEIATYNEVVAYLMLRRKWGEKLPVRQVYLQPRTMKYLESQADDLRARGFDPEVVKSLFGFKLYADGSFGTHTALMREPYQDTGNKGQGFFTDKQLNEAIELAREKGLLNVAVHAIGDEGIRRAVFLAQQWVRMAEEGKFDPTKFRIEHFELPSREVLEQVRDLGIWVTPQPNFLTDYRYEDRLGSRVTLLCPHREILKYTDNIMFGTDGMPPSALFGIWMATHAPQESQRLSFEEALLAFSLASGRYEGKDTRSFEEGTPADIIVADEKLLEQMTTGGAVEKPQDIKVKDLTNALEANIKKVYLRGELVHSK